MRYGPERGTGWGVEAHYLQLLQVSLWIDMSCCYLINFGMESRLEELKRNAGVFKLVFFIFYFLFCKTELFNLILDWKRHVDHLSTS